jgi:hypothetical protein
MSKDKPNKLSVDMGATLWKTYPKIGPIFSVQRRPREGWVRRLLWWLGCRGDWVSYPPVEGWMDGLPRKPIVWEDHVRFLL